ncbi:DUF3471 domain-containing protein [Winogradskyella sp.]|uniref:DUF3471 domain-containing protein n=1 Tax=Winogradskyella sp. TaxID=1883156 RepID=UPI00261C2EDD|nr:DUF3471 domain-containing protein [Winogradskyella sp.]
MNQSIKSLLLGSIGLLMLSGTVSAQVDKSSKLFKALKSKDSILFKIGFNKCEIERSAELMFDDLEFYHDKGGITNSKQEFVDIMNNGICKSGNKEKIYRFLVEESLEVFPMYNNGKLYGALQNGKHFFSPDKHMTFDKSDNYALFSHLWLLDDGEWKLKRVISYNHASKEIEKDLKAVTISNTLLESYSGNYKAPNTGDVKITIDGKSLSINAGQMSATIVAISENIFKHPKAPLTFEFVKNEKGDIEKIIVRENDKIVEEATKIK